MTQSFPPATRLARLTDCKALAKLCRQPGYPVTPQAHAFYGHLGYRLLKHQVTFIKEL
jgi:hypothetical protein